MEGFNEGSVGCVHGRFQPPHKDHLAYIVAAKAKVGHLIIGITQPDPLALDPCDKNPHRQEPSSNPMTYEERCRAIDLMLSAAGVSKGEYSFSKFHIDNPEVLARTMERDVLCFTTIRDEWNVHKISLLESLGYEVNVLWDKRSEPGIAGTVIRRKIREGVADWREFLHPSVVDYLISEGIVERIRSGSGESHSGNS